MSLQRGGDRAGIPSRALQGSLGQKSRNSTRSYLDRRVKYHMDAVRLGGLRGYSRQCDRRAIRNRAIVLDAIATSQFVMKLTTRDLGCHCAATYTNRSQGGALAVTVT